MHAPRRNGRVFRWTLQNVVSAPCPPPEEGRRGTYDTPKGENPLWYVLCRGCCAADAGADGESLTGKYGHVERANAWTHLAPCALLVALAIARPFALGWTTVADYLSFCSILMDAIMFAISTAYHVFRTVPSMSAPLLSLDVSAISITIAVSVVADLCAVTRGFENVWSRAWIDPLLSSLVFFLFLWYRRLVLPESETLKDDMDGKGCGLGLYRTVHSALEHRTARTAAKVALTAMWTLYIPSALRALDPAVAATWVSGAGVGALLLVVGSALDNASVIDASLVATGKCGPCGCASTALGCVFTTHTLWHVLAATAMAINITVREVVIASWKA